MLGRTAASMKNLPPESTGESEAAMHSAQRGQFDYVRQMGVEQGLTRGGVEAYLQQAQRWGQGLEPIPEEVQMLGALLTPEQRKITDAAADEALALLRADLRAAGLGQFDIGALISTAITSAASVGSALIKRSTELNLVKQQQAMQQAAAVQQERLAQQQIAAQTTPGVFSSSGGIASTLTSTSVLIPAAIAGGGLLLFLLLRK